MISEALVFLKNRLNTHLKSSRSPDESQEEPVVFLDGQNMEPVTFKLGAVSVLLINIEEETTLRPPDRFQRSAPDGTSQKIQPDIRLNLYVLFVARYRQYEESLRYLSLIIRYFQQQRLFNHHNAPELGEDIEQLVLELITLPFSEQNEVWSSLRVTYLPSLLYKVKMVVFKDEAAISLPEVAEKRLRLAS